MVLSSLKSILQSKQLKYGLDVLLQIGKEKEDEEYARSLGFNSADEVRRSHLGNPLHLYRISLDKLKEFNKTRDPLRETAIQTNVLMYPLWVDGQARSVITVRSSPSGKQWRPTGAGYGEFILLVEKHRTPGADIVILVSDLGLKFLATRIESDFQLIPLSERKNFKRSPGPPALSARETFAKLSEQVSEYDRPLPGTTDDQGQFTKIIRRHYAEENCVSFKIRLHGGRSYPLFGTARVRGEAIRAVRS